MNKRGYKKPSYEKITQRNFGVYSWEEQQKIRTGKIAIVGVGCDGGMAAMILARMGIGQLTIIDFDRVEASNLNRQPLFTINDIGQYKTVAAKKYLSLVNPHVKIISSNVRMNEDSVHLLESNDVILQCVDNFTSRVILHRLGMQIKIPVVSMSGQPPFCAFISTFSPNGPDYEFVMNLPSLNRKLTDKISVKLELCKYDRARNADKNGASPNWYQDYKLHNIGWGGEKVGWGITPERAYITAVFQVHEALRIIMDKPVIAPAPKAIIVDLQNLQAMVRVCDPPDGQKWDYKKY